MSLLRDFYAIFYDYSGGNEILLSCLGNGINWCVWFWILNSVFLCADITGKPAWIMKYKVQKDKNVPVRVDPDRLWDALKLALSLTIISNALGTYPMYLLQVYRGCSFRVQDVPTVPGALLEIAAYIVIQEIVFYYSHRMLHLPYFYKTIHKKHHKWTAPIGLVAIYAHPAEFAISNVISVFAGAFLLGSHAVMFWLWAPVMYFITVCHHSGYHLPFLPSPEFHDYHHLKFHVNYGTWGPLDWLHGTDDKFRGTIQHTRNRNLWGLTPMSEQYPDPREGGKKDR